MMALPKLGQLRTFRCFRRKPLDPMSLKLRRAEESDVAEVVREPFLLYQANRLLVAYFHLDDDPDAKDDLDTLWRTLPHIRYSTAYRAEGMKSTSKTFGYLPRVTIRRDYCTSTAMAQQQPAEHETIAACSAMIGRYYQLVNPELFEKHREQTQRVLPEFTIEDGPFTSGIVNHNNPLPYHFDRGNFRNVWSAMLGFKRSIGGGYLNMPEFGIAAEIRDRSLLLFDGQNILHGVTPITRLAPNAQRFTVVYYSMANMWSCEPGEGELNRIRQKKTEREYRRAGRELGVPVPAEPELDELIVT